MEAVVHSNAAGAVSRRDARAEAADFGRGVFDVWIASQVVDPSIRSFGTAADGASSGACRSEQEISSLTDSLEGKLQRRSGSLALSGSIARGLLLHLWADEAADVSQRQE
jgi:hypothetical protein